FLLGSLSLFILNLVWPGGLFQQCQVVWGVVIASGMVLVARWIFIKAVDLRNLKRRVVIYGAGNKAKNLLDDLKPEMALLGVTIVGCIRSTNETVEVDPALVVEEPTDWLTFVRDRQISEIVISPDERRRGSGEAFPLQQLLDCKLA